MDKQVNTIKVKQLVQFCEDNSFDILNVDCRTNIGSIEDKFYRLFIVKYINGVWRITE